jgi:hypothetical protein
LGMYLMHEKVFADSTCYTGPDLTDDMISNAQALLGYELPRSYVELLRIRNGGVPVRRCFQTTFATSWAPDHIRIDAVLGIGGTWGIEGPGALSSPSMIKEWGYPPIGVVICDMPSGGHDAVMLDYSHPGSEPRVVYIDEDRVPHVLACSFSGFLDALSECNEG